MINEKKRYDMKSKGGKRVKRVGSAGNTPKSPAVYDGVNMTRCRKHYPRDDDKEGDQEGDVCMIGRRMTVKV